MLRFAYKSSCQNAGSADDDDGSDIANTKHLYKSFIQIFRIYHHLA